MALLVNGKITKSGLPNEILTEATLKNIYGANVSVHNDGDRVSIVPKRGNRLEGNSNSNDIE